MSSQVNDVAASTANQSPTTTVAEFQPPSWKQRLRKGLSFESIGGVYVLLAMIVLFTIWVPETFPQTDTLRQILNNNAVIALAALALVVPLSAGVFDISVPYTMTLAGIMCTYSIANNDIPVWLAILIGLSSALLVGLLNGLVVVVMKIDSLIGTLATGFLVQAMIRWRTGLRTVSSGKLQGSFRDLGQYNIARFTAPVFYVLFVATVLWYVLEHTATGRRLYAVGFNRDAARLASVRTERIRFLSLMTSAFIAGVAGVVLASIQGSGSPTGGTEYLLPAFAAVFLGATQLKGGRFNSWGTIIGVLLLGVGTTGLGLAHQPQWVQDVFKGCVLIASLAVTGLQVRRAGASSKRSLLRRGSGSRATADQGVTDAVHEP
jgi:ribose transport system permease protein